MSTANQYQINPETHAADAAMAAEHGTKFSTEGMSAEDAALWAMPVDELKSKILAEAGARDDFNKMQSEMRYMEETAAAANANPTDANLKAAITAGLRAEKADQVARQSAARIGMRDHEFNQALGQLNEFNPGRPDGLQPASAPTDPTAGFASITQNQDGTLEVKLQTGEVFKGDPLKVINTMGKSYVYGKQWTQGIKAENERLKKSSQTPLEQQPNGQPQQPNLNDPAAFNINAPQNQAPLNSDIAELFAKSVGFSDAAEMIGDYQRTQSQLQEMQSKLEAANQFASKYEDEQLAERFVMENPDFPGTPEATAILEKIMDSSDLDWSKPENLSLAHQHAIRKGLYRPLTTEEIRVANGEQLPTQSRTAPPPPPPGGAPISDDIGNPWAMATDELRKRVLERGGLGRALLDMPAGSSLGGQ